MKIPRNPFGNADLLKKSGVFLSETKKARSRKSRKDAKKNLSKTEVF